MSEPRIIKKYSNRRLYDTERSQYATLADIKQLVMEGEDFIVRDDVSGEDITRQILLQVITEQESGDQPMFTKELLTQMIQFYGGVYQGMFTDYMAKTIEMFTTQQQTYQKQFNDMLNATGFAAASELSQRNFEMLSEMQKSFLKMYGVEPKPEDKS